MNEKETKELQVAEEEKKSTSVAVNSFFKKASNVGKKVAVNVQEVAINTSQKIKDDSKNRRLKKLHPITLDEYHSEKFNLPNVIKIIDDAEIRGIDVCEGCVGRLVTEKGVEIFYITDEFVPSSGLHFVPAPICDAIYHVDNFDRSRFISTDEIFSKALEEKIAELEHIAYCLGAKSCSIEILESTAEVRSIDVENTTQANMKAQGMRANESVSVHNTHRNKHNSSGKTLTTFSGNAIIKYPRLKWFEHNDNVKNLIEMRLSEGSYVSTKTLKLMGTSSASMTQKTAIAIDAEIKKVGVKTQNSVEQQAQVEKNSILIFDVIFD